MDKTDPPALQRTFLIERLPDPLTRASGHIQLFDNYIVGTRLRLRSIRKPETREWTYILQQRTRSSEGFRIDAVEIFLSKEEHCRFEIFEGAEIRKNRYSHEFSGVTVWFDVYLGALWGLNTARVELEDMEALLAFAVPEFFLYEITNEPFFFGENLVNRDFAEMQAEVSKLESARSRNAKDG